MATERRAVIFINKIAKEWVKNKLGPVPKKDNTKGYYLKVSNQDDDHIHLVGYNGKYHPLAWSRKTSNRQWYKICFDMTPKDNAFLIYYKSKIYLNKKNGR